jgi:hypothetical protein
MRIKIDDVITILQVPINRRMALSYNELRTFESAGLYTVIS